MKRVAAEALGRAMRSALDQRGLCQTHIDYVAEGLIQTSLRGVDTHGVALFPLYLMELDGGRAKCCPEFRWHGGAKAAASLDADGALGLVAGMAAVEKAMGLARRFGVGAVAVGNSNHFGAASVYTLAMARAGMLGLAFSNSDALVAPSGGKSPFFGTNPLSMAVCGSGDELFCVDMATSQIAYTRTKRYREQGKPLEPGWALTPGGEDAATAGPAAEVGALQPLGGYKGQCLAMMVEVLCTLLTGMPFDHELSHLFREPYDRPRQTAHFFLAIDIAAFHEPNLFRQRLTSLLALVRVQEPAMAESVINPGDLERAATADRLANGIPLSEETWRALEPFL